MSEHGSSPNSVDFSLTSTPQTSSKLTPEPKPSSITTDGTTLKGPNEAETDDDDEFYDHDIELSTFVPKNQSPPPILSTPSSYSSLNKQFEYANNNNNASTNKHYYQYNNNHLLKPPGESKKKKKSIYYIITLVFIGFCFIMFVISIIQYGRCNLSAPVGTNCQYSAILTRLNDNFLAVNRRLLGYVPFMGGASSNYRWISWPIASPNSTNLSFDPLFSWFFSQYEAN